MNHEPYRGCGGFCALAFASSFVSSFALVLALDLERLRKKFLILISDQVGIDRGKGWASDLGGGRGEGGGIT